MVFDLIRVCAWCPPREIPAGKKPTHYICPSCLQLNFPEQAEALLAKKSAETEIELANSFLGPQAF